MVRRIARLLALGSYFAGVVVDPAGTVMHHAWHALRGEDGAHSHGEVEELSHEHPHRHGVHPWFAAPAHSHAPVVDALLKLGAGAREENEGNRAALPQLEHLSPGIPSAWRPAPAGPARIVAEPEADSTDLRPPTPPPLLAH
jgi:hypothetical protein